MAWIKIIEPKQATGQLARIYGKLGKKNQQIDQILQVHSLRPATLVGHMTLYKNVLHHHQNTTPKWFLETLGIYVSILNSCVYCIEHHSAGLERLLSQSEKEDIRARLERGQTGSFPEKYALALKYAFHLTLHPGNNHQSLVHHLQLSGWTDGEILEINQVISYFNYANRTVMGLGVDLSGEALGLSPSKGNSWEHE